MITVEGMQATSGPSCTSPAKCGWSLVPAVLVLSSVARPSVYGGPNDAVPMTTLVKLIFSKLDYSLIKYVA